MWGCGSGGTCPSSPVWKSVLFTVWIPGTKLRCESQFLSLPGPLAALFFLMLLIFSATPPLTYS